ncbi:MAG: hypothetical protein IPM23_06435 [Candidatus Melainabacteria bacterium]|nr:hypothetical protein [Candidatus Melainabacteria bacterium]
MILPEVPSYYSMPSGGPDRVIDFRRLRGCPGWSSDNFGSPCDGIPRLIMDLIAMSARGSQESWLDPSRQNQGWPIGGWQGNWQKVAPQDNWRSGYGMPPALARELASRAHRTGEQAWRNTPPGQTGGRWRADYGVAPGLAEELSRRAQQTREQAWRNTRPGQTGGRWRADYGVAPGIGNDLADRDLQNKLEAWYLRRRN